MRLLCLVSVLVLVGCGNRAPSCKDAVEQAARTLGDDAKLIVKQMTAVCERTGWTAEQRRCVANAEGKLAVGMCIADAVVSTATSASEEPAVAKQVVQAKQEAMKQAQEALDRAQGKVDTAAKDLADFDDRLMKVQSALMHAKNDAERAAVEAQLPALRKEKVEIDARLAAMKAEAEAAARAMRQALEAVPR